MSASDSVARSAQAAPSQLLEPNAGYQRWASIYDQTPNPLLSREERYFEPRVPTLSGKQALDVACGTARWLHKFMARGANRAVGLDLSPAMLRVARQKVEFGQRLIQADCRSLPLTDQTFDFAMCSFTLSHLEDLRPATQELSRVLRSGSLLLVSDLHPQAYAQGWRTGFRDGDGPVEIRTVPRPAEEFIKSFVSAGFECLNQVSLHLGDAERATFAAAGREHYFEHACRVPAILALSFKRSYRKPGKRY